jgi:hypothetical protein
MKAMGILAVRHVIPIAAGAGAVPLIGASSLASFALGALVAGVCFAALTSPWWQRNAILVPVRSDRSGPARPGLSRPDHPANRLAGHPVGLRGRVDAPLAGLLSDDADDPDQAPDSSGHEFVNAATAAAAREIRLSGGPATPVGDGHGTASAAAPDPAPAASQTPEPETAAPQTPASEAAFPEPEARPGPAPAQAGAPKPDEIFWGPMSVAERDREPRRSGSVRNAPRHAAPPARFSLRRALAARRPTRRDEVPDVPGLQVRAS